MLEISVVLLLHFTGCKPEYADNMLMEAAAKYAAMQYFFLSVDLLKTSHLHHVAGQEFFPIANSWLMSSYYTRLNSIVHLYTTCIHWLSPLRVNLLNEG